MTPNKQCDGCGSFQPASQQSGNYIDYGWSIHWPELGHYGGFTDTFFDRSAEKQDGLIHLCHDCCVKLLQTFPALIDKMKVRGGHPNANERNSDDGISVPPCCPYAWTWVRDRSQPNYEDQFTEYLATPELTWEKMERPSVDSLTSE